MKNRFTLIELIVSIVVIGILAAIVMLNISDLRLQAEETARAATERELQTAVDRHYLDYGVYPTIPQPTKNNPQWLESDKVVPEYIRKDYADDYLVEVDDKGTVTVIRKSEEADKPAYEKLACEEAEEQGYTCIYTPVQFDSIRNNMGGKYILMNDIDLVSFPDWKPIGTGANPFKGIINGNGYKVENMTLTKAHLTADYASPVVSALEGYGYGLFGFVSYGEISNLSLENAKLDINDSETNHWDFIYTSLLVGYLYSSPENNPSKEKTTISNISINGEADLSTGDDNDFVYGFSTLIGIIDINSDLIIEEVRTDVDTSGFRDAFGLFGYATLQEGEALSVLVNNIQVNGNINAGYIGGVASYFDSIDNDGKISFTNIEMNADLSGDGSIYGFMDYLQVYDGDTESVVKDIKINGNIISTGNRDVNGFASVLEFMDTGKSTIENIYINGKIESAGVASGFVEMIHYTGGTGDQVTRNINIASEIKASVVFGIASHFAIFNTTHPVIIEDISSTSGITASTIYIGATREITAEETNDVQIRDFEINHVVRKGGSLYNPGYEYGGYGFAETIQVTDNLNEVIIKNIDIQSAIQFKGDFYEFARWVDRSDADTQMNDKLILENISMNGSITTESGNIQRLVHQFYFNNGKNFSPVFLKDITMNMSLQAEDGSIQQVTDADLTKGTVYKKIKGRYFYDPVTYEPYQLPNPSFFEVQNVKIN